jgi:predicted DNA binding protein
MDEQFERAPVGILEIDPTGTVRAVNERADALLDIGSAGVTDETVGSLFPMSVEASVPRAFETPPEERLSVEEFYPDLDSWFEVTVVPADDTVLVYVRDVTDRHRLEKELTERNADITRLTVINELISDVLAALVDASTREEIAETICTRLGETELYDFAWLGERELGTDDIVVRAASGTTGRTLDSIESTLETGEDIPEARVVEAGQPEIVQPVGANDSVPTSVRRAAFADGLQSMLAIPLTYGSTVYGVVGLYTSEQDAFSSRERASFGTLGEMAGFAVNATRHRSVLLSDTVVELRLRITDRSDPLVAAAAEHEASVSVDGLVPAAETPLCYLTVDGADPADVAESLAATETVESTRVVDGTGGSVEVGLGGESLLGRLLARGGTVTSATFDSSGGTVTVDISPDEDLRRLAEGVTRGLDAEVAAKRERDEEVVTPRAFRDRLDDRLTERQESALRTAYLADYFESPRESTAEEVAEALDITGPTLLHHLRAGQRKLLAEFFDLHEDHPRSQGQ